MSNRRIVTRFRITAVCLLAVVSAGVAAGQEVASDDSVGAPSLTAWEYVQPIPLGEPGDSPWLDFVLTSEVFDGARLDLADLRLYDARGDEVPYSCRELRAKDEIVEAKTEPFNKSQGADGSSQLSLDLGETSIEHNEVEIKTPGRDFRRRTLVEGSDDGEQWSRLAEKNLLRFTEGDRSWTDLAIEYSPCRYRYLRLSVYRDSEVDRDPVEIESATVRRRIEVPGEDVTRTVSFTPREATRSGSSEASRWVIDLDGENVPCHRLMVKIKDPEFARDYQVEAGGPPGAGEPFWYVTNGTWQRRAGERDQHMVAEFPEVKAARLRLIITDHSNPALTISSIQAAAPARQIVCARDAELEGPLNLYFGNPKAQAPNYDFARNLPETLKPAPDRLKLGARDTNPVFEPEPLPLTERLPWLIYVVLGFAVAVLGLLIANLARAAILASDAREATAEQQPA